MKVQGVSINSANVRYNNASDDSRVYDIEANVRIVDSTRVQSVDGGFVKKDGKAVCTFSTYSEGQMNTNLQNVSDVMEMCAILQAINTFVLGVIEEVKKGTAVVLN